jgi:hypothetical protein
MTAKSVRIRRVIVHALLHSGNAQFAREAIEVADEVERWVSHGGPLPPCVRRELERDDARRQAAIEE